MSGRDVDGTAVEESKPCCPYCASQDLEEHKRKAIYLGTKKTGRTVTGWTILATCRTCGRDIETRTSYGNKY